MWMGGSIYPVRQAALLSAVMPVSYTHLIISDPEVEGTGIKSALTTLSQALADFSQYPYQQTNANIVMHAFQGVTQVLNEYDANLKTLMEQTKNDFSIAVKAEVYKRQTGGRRTAGSSFYAESYAGAGYEII